MQSLEVHNTNNTIWYFVINIYSFHGFYIHIQLYYLLPTNVQFVTFNRNLAIMEVKTFHMTTRHVWHK